MADWDTWGQLYYNAAYNPLPNLVAATPGVQLERGVSDELDLKPGTCSFRLNDPTDLYRPSNAASSLYGQTGPYMRGAFATGGSVRFTGETQTMSPGETDDHVAVAGSTVKGHRWVDVKLGGPLARIGRWRDDLASPLFTQISGYGTDLRGYWPLEDSSDATQLTNARPGGRPGTFLDLQLGQAERPPGAASSVQLGTGGAGNMAFRYGAMNTLAGFQFGFAMRLPNVDSTLREVWGFRTTSGYLWSWRVSDSAYNIRVLDRDGATVVDASAGHGEPDAAPGNWVFHRLKVSTIGTSVTIEPSWYSEAAAVFWGFTAGFTGSMGAPQSGYVTASPAAMGGQFSHHFVLAGTANDLESSDFTTAFRAYTNERAVTRFKRLCSSRGISYVIRGTEALTAPMGPQPVATFQDQLKQVRATEGGLIFDRGDNIGVVFVTRDQLYDNAAAPVINLTWPDDIGRGFREATDATDAFNYVTAKNATGGSFTTELATGRLGTANPPTGSGRLDKTVNVNHNTDDPLEDTSNWWLRFWTQNVPRFDSVTVDVDAHPSLLSACHAAEPGTFMTITGRTPDPLLLLILSTSQATNRKRNVFTFTVVPGDVFRVAVEDSSSSLLDSGSTTLVSGLNTTATSVSVISADPLDAWKTSGGYDVVVAGERWGVTSVTAGSASGTGWAQTMTVTRSKNGVVKTQAAGAEVHIFNPVHEG